MKSNFISVSSNKKFLTNIVNIYYMCEIEKKLQPRILSKDRAVNELPGLTQQFLADVLC